MKAKSIFILVFILTNLFETKAQYTKLVTFDTINENLPQGSFVWDGSFLYGMAYSGGTNGEGAIFKIKPDGSGYTTVFSFSGVSTGAYPVATSLLYDGAFLYGMTSYGGANNYGVVFKVKTDGTSYLKLLDFNITNGSQPYGNLIIEGTYLYGMAPSGGANGHGILFRIKTDGTGYAGLLNFASGTGDGKQPYSSLVSDGTYLYGTTRFGGSVDSGTVFKIKPDGTSYSIIHNFNGLDGSYSHSPLMYDGTFLYGMTTNGGVNNYGVVFKIKPDGTSYTKLLDFAGLNGRNPMFGGLISDGSFLYGTTEYGGANNDGVIFKIKSDGTAYSKLFDFSAVEGQGPACTLLSNAGYLFGNARYGGGISGPSGEGVLFKFRVLTEIGIDESREQFPVSIYPNPSAGVFTLKTDQPNLNIKELKVYNCLSECIYTIESLKVNPLEDMRIDLSSQPEGVYFIEMKTEKGITTKKILICK